MKKKYLNFLSALDDFAVSVSQFLNAFMSSYIGKVDVAEKNMSKLREAVLKSDDLKARIIYSLKELQTHITGYKKNYNKGDPSASANYLEALEASLFDYIKYLYQYEQRYLSGKRLGLSEEKELFYDELRKTIDFQEMVSQRVIPFKMNLKELLQLGIKDFKDLGSNSIVSDIESILKDANSLSLTEKATKINKLIKKMRGYIIELKALAKINPDNSAEWRDSFKKIEDYVLSTYIDPLTIYLMNLLKNDWNGEAPEKKITLEPWQKTLAPIDLKEIRELEKRYRNFINFLKQNGIDTQDLSNGDYDDGPSL